jgi:hypothetical protein
MPIEVLVCFYLWEGLGEHLQNAFQEHIYAVRLLNLAGGGEKPI